MHGASQRQPAYTTARPFRIKRSQRSLSLCCLFEVVEAFVPVGAAGQSTLQGGTTMGVNPPSL